MLAAVRWFVALWITLQCAVFTLAEPARAAVLTGYYKLPAVYDTEIHATLAIELWAQVWRPSGKGPFPLVVLLHGNHETCGYFDPMLGIRVDDRVDYTSSGLCPDGYVVTPNHMGYEYLATDLAGRGYIVVSINANRGINAAPGIPGDIGLNLARGKLVLRHLQQLSKWNRGVGSPPSSLGFRLKNRIDFRHVGLMGHSRGGEGMRAALALFRDPGSPWPARIGDIRFRGLFEIGPVDGQTDRILDAPGLPWAVLLPGCDGDVVDLDGMRPFERMLLRRSERKSWPKSMLEVFGANHNYYNSEWLTADTNFCSSQTKLFPPTGGSAVQRKTALIPFRRFMLAHVGPDRRERLARMFDPSYPLPSSLTDITLHARAHTPTPRKGQSFIIDDFENVTGVSSRGFNNAWGGLTMLANGGAGRGHDPVQRVAEIAWAAPGGFLQLNATAPGTRRDVSGYEALQLRVTPRCVMLACPFVSNADGDLNLSVALVTGKGRLSKAVPIKKFAAIRRPVSGFIDIELLQTVRIPLAAFEGADLKKFRGVRILFDKSSTGHIYLANVRLDRKEAGPGGQTRAMEERAAVAGSGVEIPVMAGEHRIVATRRIGRGRNAPVEIEFSSTARFPVGASLPELTIGQERFRLSQFPGGALDRIVFRLSAAEFARVRDGAPVQIRLGGRGIWNFGSYQRQ